MGKGGGGSQTVTQKLPNFALNAGRRASAKAINQSEPIRVAGDLIKNLTPGTIGRGEPLVYRGSRHADLDAIELDAINQAQDSFGAPNPLAMLGQEAFSDVLGSKLDPSGLLSFSTGGDGLQILNDQMGLENAGIKMLQDRATAPIDTSFLDDTIAAAIDPTRQSIDSLYSRAGRLGSDAHGEALGRGITEAVAPILASEYARQDAQKLSAANAVAGYRGADLGRDAQLAGLLTDTAFGAESDAARLGLEDQRLDLAGLSSLPMFQDLERSRLANLSGAGEALRADAQADIDDQLGYLNDINAGKQYSMNALLSAAGMGSTFGGSTTTSTNAGGNFLTRGLGGAASGLGLASMIPGLAPFTAPLAIGGGLLGAVGSLF